MPRWVWPVALLIVIAGGLAGYLSVPHYRAPRLADEARLRERAVGFYRASKRLDMRAMVGFYSPALQLNPDESLTDVVAQRSADLAKMNDTTRERLAAAAEGVTGDLLELRVEGDWAVSSGTFNLPASGDRPATDAPLESTVWVRSAGEWWIYQLKTPELLAYGNPPDFARIYLVGQPPPDSQEELEAAAAGAGKGDV